MAELINLINFILQNYGIWVLIALFILGLAHTWNGILALRQKLQTQNEAENKRLANKAQEIFQNLSQELREEIKVLQEKNERLERQNTRLVQAVWWLNIRVTKVEGKPALSTDELQSLFEIEEND